MVFASVSGVVAFLILLATLSILLKHFASVWKSHLKKKTTTTKAMTFGRSFDDSVEMTSDTHHVDSTDLLGSASVERCYEPIGPTASSSELLHVYRALRQMLTENSDDFPINGHSDLTLPPMSSTDRDLRRPNCTYVNVTFDTQ